MTDGPQIRYLPDGQRLHLHHGPIDLIIDAIGPDRDQALDQAAQRFQTVLTSIVPDLERLRRPLGADLDVRGEISRRMVLAISPYQHVFVTPMAAVAGAVADSVLAAMKCDTYLTKAYVNNGGDIAFHIANGHGFQALGAAGPMSISSDSGARGIATSGWRGRSLSLGIADAVTVVAQTAAQADVAATLIANAVNLPDHAAIRREPAQTVSPDSDLGARPVTKHVGSLTDKEIQQAIKNGAVFARAAMKRGAIAQVAITLNGQSTVLVPVSDTQKTGQLAYA